MALLVTPGHWRKIKGFDPFSSDGCADQSSSVGRHEGNGLWSGPGGCTDEVGFVFPARIVGHDHEFAGSDIRDNFFDGAEREGGHGLGEGEWKCG